MACSSVARPVIGITTYVTPAKWSHWELEAALVPADYVHAVERAGGRALLVPPSDDGVDETLESLDGLIFSGGSDLDPELYGQEAHAETSGVVRNRDTAELALLEAALERDMPVLAICRGTQVLNVARGGDLVQHLPDVVGDEKHKHTPGTFADHDVSVEDGSRLASVLGRACAGEVAPPSGIRKGRRRPTRRGPRGRRNDRSSRRSNPSLRPRSAVASGGRRGRAPLRRAGSRSGAVPLRPCGLIRDPDKEPGTN